MQSEHFFHNSMTQHIDKKVMDNKGVIVIRVAAKRVILSFTYSVELGGNYEVQN